MSRISELLVHHCQFASATIAVDAVSLDSVFLSDRQAASTESKPSHAFVYQCLPLTTGDICFPLHAMPGNSGNATREHVQKGESILRVLAGPPRPVRVFFIATDGDRGYSAMYQNQLTKWFPLWCWSGLLACLGPIRDLGEPLYVADFLHLTKDVRSRLLTYIPVIRYGTIVKDVHWEVMEPHLHLGPVFTDRRSTGKMRDADAIALFRLAHVTKLLGDHCDAEAIFLLPWALAMLSFGSGVIAKSTRHFLLGLALRLLTFLYVDETERGAYLNEQGPPRPVYNS